VWTNGCRKAKGRCTNSVSSIKFSDGRYSLESLIDSGHRLLSSAMIESGTFERYRYSVKIKSPQIGRCI